jgi:hypothetical protein
VEVSKTAMNTFITVVLDIPVSGGFKTALNMFITAVSDISISGGFKNRAEYVHNHGIRYID